jgi:hypothetical protein
MKPICPKGFVMEIGTAQRTLKLCSLCLICFVIILFDRSQRMTSHRTQLSWLQKFYCQ